MTQLAVYFDPEVLRYVLPAGVFEAPPSPLLAVPVAHPEGPERIANIHSILTRGPLAERLLWHRAEAATEADLARFHSEAYLAHLREVEATGGRLSSTTCLPPEGLRFGRLAVGQALAAVQHVFHTPEHQAYALVRPASHHAAPERADGYCYYNATALAALEGLAQGAQRVAVVDWDTHHGNGTQTGFYERDDILTVSLHMDHGAWGEAHPEQGSVAEHGAGRGAGYNLNFPLPFGAGDITINAVMQALVAPALRRFNPDLIVVANGQDANAFDPNGRQRVTMQGFHALATAVREVADGCCDGRLVLVQEGGYNPAYAPFCAYATVAGALGAALQVDDPLAYYPDDQALCQPTLEALRQAHGQAEHRPLILD